VQSFPLPLPSLLPPGGTWQKSPAVVLLESVLLERQVLFGQVRLNTLGHAFCMWLRLCECVRKACEMDTMMLMTTSFGHHIPLWDHPKVEQSTSRVVVPSLACYIPVGYLQSNAVTRPVLSSRSADLDASAPMICLQHLEACPSFLSLAFLPVCACYAMPNSAHKEKVCHIVLLAGDSFVLIFARRLDFLLSCDECCPGCGKHSG